MKEEEILKALELPKSTWIMRTFPFNKLSSHLNLKQRRFMSETITTRGIRVLASINSANTNIPSYENETERYEEIHIFIIKVENLKHTKEIFKILNNNIPYPLIIIFSHQTNYQIILSSYEKETQKLSLKTTDLFMSHIVDYLENYLSKLSFKRMDKMNLKSLYKSILKSMLDMELKNQYGITENSSKDINLLRKLNNLDKDIENLVKKAQKERQMNRRIEYQMKANKLKDKKNRLLQGEN